MQKYCPIELVQLRLLQQGRGTCSDGRDWLRMALGITATLCVSMLALYFDHHVLSFGMFTAGLVATVEWIMWAGRIASMTLEADLKSRLKVS